MNTYNGRMKVLRNIVIVGGSTLCDIHLSDEGFITSVTPSFAASHAFNPMISNEVRVSIHHSRFIYSFIQSIKQSINLSIYLSICLSVYLSIKQSINQWLCHHYNCNRSHFYLTVKLTSEGEFNGGGRTLLPGLVDAHVHLDKVNNNHPLIITRIVVIGLSIGSLHCSSGWLLWSIGTNVAGYSCLCFNQRMQVLFYHINNVIRRNVSLQFKMCMHELAEWLSNRYLGVSPPFAHM